MPDDISPDEPPEAVDAAVEIEIERLRDAALRAEEAEGRARDDEDPEID
ncbi:MAG TPA: hypothetical protein VNJ53_13200 [Gaiellaceae bacterium]|nr:hypothetical protein [Gaiellaceae bacterium]